jgi:hypothetical protein
MGSNAPFQYSGSRVRCAPLTRGKLPAENKLKTVEAEQKQKVAIAEAEASARPPGGDLRGRPDPVPQRLQVKARVT